MCDARTDLFHTSFSLQQVTLRDGSQAFGWWAKPPVEPMIRVYIYNVTNADEFLNNGSKPIVDELGPYVYVYVYNFPILNILNNKGVTSKVWYLIRECN